MPGLRQRNSRSGTVETGTGHDANCIAPCKSSDDRSDLVAHPALC